MKKMLMMAAVAIFTMTSCSDDSNSNTDNNNPANLVLKKAIYHYDDGSVVTATFNYAGNKLSTITDTDGYTETYTYNNLDQIVKIQHAGPDNFDQKDVFTYDPNGRIVEYKRTFEHTHNGTRYVLVYNNDGTVTKKTFTGDDVNQLNNTTIDHTINYTNDNVVSIDNTDLWTFTTTLDPWSLITGYANLSIAFGDGGINNIASYKRTNTITGQTMINYTYTYTYNNGSTYPATETEHDVLNNDDTTIEYFYE